MARITLYSLLAPDAPPQLSYSLPSQRFEPSGTITPPLRPMASVPFEWEEVPGKPIIGINNIESSPTHSCLKLELPPRMIAVALSATETPSPTNVLDGPEAAITIGSCYSFSFREPRGYSTRSVGKKKQHGFWSCTRKTNDDSSNAKKGKYYNDNDDDAGWGMNYLESLGLEMDSYPYCSSVSSSSSSRFSSMVHSFQDHEGECCKLSIPKLRNKSVANLSTTDLWANIYGSLKQVVQWRKHRRGV